MIAKYRLGHVAISVKKRWALGCNQACKYIDIVDMGCDFYDRVIDLASFIGSMVLKAWLTCGDKLKSMNWRDLVKGSKIIFKDFRRHPC